MVAPCRLFILALQASLAIAEIVPYALPSLLDATIDDIKAGLESGSFNSTTLVEVRSTPGSSIDPYSRVLTFSCQAYLARIAEVNPVLNAVTEVNPDALEIALALDVERAQGRVRGYELPFHTGRIQTNPSPTQASPWHSHPLKEQHRHP